MQDGIGDKFSISVQLICNFIFGYLIGFVVQWRLALFLLGCAPLLIGASLIFTKAGRLQGLLGFHIHAHLLNSEVVQLSHLTSPLLPHAQHHARPQLLSVFFSREQVEYARAGAVAEEVLGSIRTVVAFGGEQKEYNRYKGKLTEAKKLGVKKGVITGVMNGLIYVIIFTVYAAALT